MFLYLITNLKNQKKYVGITRNYKERMNYHKTRSFQIDHREYEKPLYRAFRKHGLDSFKFEILRENLTVEEAKELEVFYIQELNTLTRNNHGYNITRGGEFTGLFGEDHKDAILTEEEALDIINRRKSGEKRSDVYTLYSHKITFGGFVNVWQGRSWSHLDPEFSNRTKDGRDGPNNPNSVLSKEDILWIRTQKKDKRQRMNVYRDFLKNKTISEATFNRVWYGYTYKNIKV